MILVVALPSVAQDKMWAGAGLELGLPMGSFSDSHGIGFGATGRFQYNFMPQVAGGVEIDYIVWGGKSVQGYDVPNFKGLPLRVFGKYYFMPSPKALRVYGKVALGLFFGSVGASFTPGNGDTVQFAGRAGCDSSVKEMKL